MVTTANFATALVRATQLERSGRFSEAENEIVNALRNVDINPEVALKLASLAFRRDDRKAAINYMMRSLKERPSDPIRRANLGAMYLRVNRPDEALNQLVLAAKKLPNDPPIIRNLAQAYYQLGRSELAIRTAERLLTFGQIREEALLDLARYHDVAGDLAEARVLYSEVLLINDRRVEAYDGWARAQRFQSRPVELSRIMQLLDDTHLSERERFVLHLAAGKILDDLGEYNEAFFHFKTGNGLLSPEAIEQSARRFAEMRKVFTKSFFQSRAGWGVTTRRPVFIVGMPRSGTSLVEQILASHPDIYGANELPFMTDAVRQARATHADSWGWAEDVPCQFVSETAREYLKLLDAFSRTASRVTDKLPQNFENLWLIVLCFPNASIIHCKRDPMDTCFSCFTNTLGLLHRAATLENLGRYYRLYEEMMLHWHDVLPAKILDVQYEQLVTNSQPEISRMLLHIGMNWSASCLRPESTYRAVRTPSRWQVRNKINLNAIGRWRPYIKHLDSLCDALKPSP